MRKRLLIVALVVIVLSFAVLTSGLAPTRAAEGWTGYYYQNSTLSGSPSIVQVDPVISFDWGDRPPDNFAGWSGDYFSVRWVRDDNFANAVYAFAVASDDGVRLYIDGQLIIDEWRGRQGEFTIVEREMSAGTHRIVVEYFEETGRAAIQAGYYPIDGSVAATQAADEDEVGGGGGTGATRTPTASPSPTATSPFLVGTPGVDTPAQAVPVAESDLQVEENDAKAFLWEGFPGPVERGGGHGGSHSYVKNREVKESLAVQWRYQFADDGYYDVYVYVPQVDIPVTQSAVYRVFAANQLSAPIVVNQSANQGLWVYLGPYYFLADTAQYVTLSNLTGEDSASTEVLFDTVMFVYNP